MAHTDRREARDAKRGLAAWQTDLADSIAAAHPLVPTTAIRASGNHLVAAQDEPEPVDRGPLTIPAELSEDEWLEADVVRDRNKGPSLAARNDARALTAQVMDLDAMRRAGWL